MWYNKIIIWILSSPLHWLLSESIMLVKYRGRRTQKRYETPVNYVRDDNIFYVISLRSRTWWKNLRGGQPVVVRVRGRELEGFGEVHEDDAGVASGLTEILQRAPRYAKYLRVGLSSDGRPKPEDVTRAAGERVVIRIAAGVLVKEPDHLQAPTASALASGN